MARALGRYELLRPLARGGMAEVYLARRRAAGVEKWLVVKRMRPEHGGDARFLDLFVREARLSMSLTHQNIVPVFDFGRIDDQVFLAMERVEGKDLGSSLARAEAHCLPPVVAAFVAAECCQALDYAHNRRAPDGTALGIVHRDVTPRNVLVSWSGEVKLTDFGIAALAGDAPMKTIGTPAYMAPEQARAEALDARADVYAIGLVLREALTGVRARPGEDKDATLAAARAGTLVPWPAEPAVDPRLVAIVDRATALDREARYPDARTMLAELDAFIVAERAAHKGDAPARQLAAWLAAVWKEEREETAIDEAIEAQHLVSFMDDGALDVLGTGTMRSMMATADEEVAPGADRPQASGLGPRAAEGPRASGLGPRDSEDTAPPAPAPSEAPRRANRVLPIVIVVAVAVIAALWITHTAAPVSTAPSAGSAPVAIAPSPPDAREQPEAPPIDAAPPVVVDAEVLPAPPDAAAAPKHHPKGPPEKHPGSAAVLAPPAVTYRVVINAIPWANFTIDSDPTVHQTLETVHLTPGSHVIHFTNPELGASKDTSITVPETDDLRVVETLTK